MYLPISNPYMLSFLVSCLTCEIGKLMLILIFAFESNIFHSTCYRLERIEFNSTQLNWIVLRAILRLCEWFCYTFSIFYTLFSFFFFFFVDVCVCVYAKWKRIKITEKFSTSIQFYWNSELLIVRMFIYIDICYFFYLVFARLPYKRCNTLEFLFYFV